MNQTEIIMISMAGTILSFALLLLTFILMGVEGRYHLWRSLSRKGIDVLLYNKLSRKVTPITIEWTGKLWQYGKNAMYFGLDVLKDPNDSQQQFNRAMQDTAQWAGNRRPVLLASENLSFVYTPALAELLKAEDTPEDVKNTLKWLEKHDKDGFKKVSVVTPIPHDSLSTYISSSTPDEVGDTYDIAYGDGTRDATKPKKGLAISPMKIAIGAGAIIMIIILLLLVQKGAIKIPNLPIMKLWWASWIA